MGGIDEREREALAKPGTWRSVGRAPGRSAYRSQSRNSRRVPHRCLTGESSEPPPEGNVATSL